MNIIHLVTDDPADDTQSHSQEVRLVKQRRCPAPFQASRLRKSYSIHTCRQNLIASPGSSKTRENESPSCSKMYPKFCSVTQQPRRAQHHGMTRQERPAAGRESPPQAESSQATRLVLLSSTISAHPPSVCRKEALSSSVLPPH